MRREGDHLPRLVALGALEVLEQAEAVAARQLDVEEDERRALAAQRLEQPGAVGQADDVVPLEREPGGEELEVVGLVFDDHDRSHYPRSGRSAARGRGNQNV